MTASPVSVSELTARIKTLLENDPRLQEVLVAGELSDCKLHSSGHYYFRLKDAASRIDCVFFRFRQRSLRFQPADGMAVRATGHIEVYTPRGNYQLHVHALEPDGQGEAERRLEELKRKLATEGLTSPDRKRPLPERPERIGLVSSLDSAGLRDILTILARRYPLATVVIAPVNVEGVAAAPSIAEGLRLMADRGRADVVIVGRGGGSAESLWGFNTELVARAIAAMPVPVVSAVGHETDTTLADLVADRRAATPSEAAELVAPARDDLADDLLALDEALRRAATRAWRARAERHALRGRLLRSPAAALAAHWRRVTRRQERLEAALRRQCAAADKNLLAAERRLVARSPRLRLLTAGHELAARRERLGRRLSEHEAAAARKLQVLFARLETLNPRAILARGYAVALLQGRALRTASEAAVGETVQLKLHRGELDCEVTKRMEENHGQG